jgi:hypothetical protein
MNVDDYIDRCVSNAEFDQLYNPEFQFFDEYNLLGLKEKEGNPFVLE